MQIGAEEMEEEKARGLHEMTVNSSPASLYISAGDASIRIRLPDEAKAASLAADLRELLARKEGGCVNETEMTAGCAADRTVETASNPMRARGAAEASQHVVDEAVHLTQEVAHAVRAAEVVDEHAKVEVVEYDAEDVQQEEVFQVEAMDVHIEGPGGGGEEEQ